ncbi:hypothetical protein KKC1_29800 [Calderihabitans maritimus]|uniref:Uncharacterized protein n=1 Tax=Calderihabitans maritimus TaxID=1246530 RepID=A0A1Z5HX17_9FIRM|nr:hypothetical protein KKC1_29800 [Calderihabitans maritimus]
MTFSIRLAKGLQPLDFNELQKYLKGGMAQGSEAVPQTV